MNQTVTCNIPLPAGFRQADFFEFHLRDRAEIAERVMNSTLHKGLVWRGRPACLSIALQQDHALSRLELDEAHEADPAGLENLVRRMLGLTQAIGAFERQWQDHPQLGPLIRQQAGLRVPLAGDPFEALTWAVTGQQISLSAAVSLRRKLIRAAGLQHADGLLCYPDATTVSRLSPDTLRQAGFSQSKAQTLIALGEQVADGRLPLDQWATETADADKVRDHLLRIKGIGPWTVSYALLRGFGWLDGSLHGDAAVRRGIQRLLNAPEAISELQAREWLMPFSPWRALVAAHLWAFNARQADHPVRPA